MKFAKLFRHAMVSIALPFNTDTPRCLCILREAKLCSLLLFPGFPQCFIDAARISLKAFDRQALVQNFFTHSQYMSYIFKLKANFCGRKKEGHFHYKNFLRALKWVPTWHTYTVGTKYFSLIGSQKIVANQRAGILCLPCRYIMWVLILKLSKSFYNESDLLFHVHKSWLSTS